MKIKTGIYRGIQFRETKAQGVTIIEGYDDGSRVIYALSKKEFRAKVEAWFARGETNQHLHSPKVRRQIQRHLRRA